MSSYRHLRFSGEIRDILGRVYALAFPRVIESEYDSIPLVIAIDELDDRSVRPADAIRIRRGLREFERAEMLESQHEPRRRSRRTGLSVSAATVRAFARAAFEEPRIFVSAAAVLSVGAVTCRLAQSGA